MNSTPIEFHKIWIDQFTPALAWARTFLSPTKKPWTACSGRTRCVTRMFPLQKRNRPFPLTERPLGNRPDLRN